MWDIIAYPCHIHMKKFGTFIGIETGHRNHSFKLTFDIKTISQLHQKHGLTHWGQVMHIYISKLTIIVSGNGLVAWAAPTHYLNQCWNIVNWTLRNTLQWNRNSNSHIFVLHFKILSGNWPPFCFCLNVLRTHLQLWLCYDTWTHSVVLKVVS